LTSDYAVLLAATLALRMKQREAARAYAERAVQVNPWRWQYHQTLAAVHAQNEDWGAAIRECQEALKLDPNGMAEAHLRLATLYNGAGMKEKAAVEYEQFLKKKPDYQERKKLEEYIAANKPKPSVKQ